ncbi:MAG: cob(I)yrinic acid a,c-diamide adenosyltransferase [Lachnospiraceae bacterium]|nr:cob(I)yrinic acid a,c-diamide adenosyltransferase [Lachnospiraceae bacterium]
MNKECVEIICGSGRGKTTMALGKSIRACAHGSSVVIVQFLKGRETGELSYLSNLNLDIKLFSFEKSNQYYEELNEQERAEQKGNIINGLCFARKVAATRECNLLVLDEVLGVLDYGIVQSEDVIQIITKAREEGVYLILTGRSVHPELREYVDSVTVVETEDVEEK